MILALGLASTGELLRLAFFFFSLGYILRSGDSRLVFFPLLSISISFLWGFLRASLDEDREACSLEYLSCFLGFCSLIDD
jgi:hypothetical protein